jgi:hypothetical protein
MFDLLFKPMEQLFPSCKQAVSTHLTFLNTVRSVEWYQGTAEQERNGKDSRQYRGDCQ